MTSTKWSCCLCELRHVAGELHSRAWSVTTNRCLETCYQIHLRLRWPVRDSYFGNKHLLVCSWPSTVVSNPQACIVSKRLAACIVISPIIVQSVRCWLQEACRDGICHGVMHHMSALHAKKCLTIQATRCRNCAAVSRSH